MGKRKLGLPIRIVLFCLLAAIVLIAITFGFEGWLVDTTTNNSYGIWRACLASTTICASWTDYALILIDFNLSSSYIAFQVLQCFMLATNLLNFLTLLISSNCCCPSMPLLIMEMLAIVFSSKRLLVLFYFSPKFANFS
jgi:hypothetical protein